MRDLKHHLHIELTKEQFQRLSENAKRCGLSRRAYLARLIEGMPVKARPSPELRELRTEINHIGVNINQIARKANAGFATREDVRELMALLGEVYRLLYRLTSA